MAASLVPATGDRRKRMYANGMRKVKFAISGCGTLTSETILPHLSQPDFLDRAEVVALCDLVPERAHAAAERFGVPQSFASLAEMLERSDAEAVLIITPHNVHAQQARQAIAAGRHVYVQKPMASDLVEGRAMLAEAKANGVKIAAAPGQGLWPMYGLIREAIERGDIGHPFWAMPPMMGWGNRELSFPHDPSWFFQTGAGPLRDHGGYGFQSLVSLFGPALRVTAMAGIAVPERFWRGNPFPVTEPENTVSLFDFGRARFGLMPECWSDTAPSVRMLRVLGLEGSIETDPETFNGLDILPIGATVRPMGKTPYRIEVPLESVPFAQGRHPELGHTHVYGDILHLADCILENAKPQNSGARALHFVEAVGAALRSAKTGIAQELETAAMIPG